MKIYENEKNQRLLYPHLLTKVSENMDVMKEEIFGTIIPILGYNDINEAITFISKRPRPLAMYLMSRNQKVIDRLLKSTHSGWVCVNDTSIHAMADDAPFGGIGPSGMGHYHGHEGFLAFSKAKTVLVSKSWIPKNRYLLEYRDFMLKLLRIILLR